MAKEFSYEYQNTVRDVSEIFAEVMTKVPTLAALLGAPLLGLDGNPLVATNTKHEWMQDNMAPKSWTVNATRNVAGATLVLTSTTGVKEGMVLAFESALGATKTVQLVVTAVTNATDLAVAVYGGSTDVQLVATDKAKLIARPKGESTDPEKDDGYEPTMEYNYTQIFDRTAQVSKTSQEVTKYGIANALDYQVAKQIKELAYDMGNQIIFGRRVQRTGNTATTRGSFGGILYFMEAASGNKVDAANADISPSIINDGFELGMSNGAMNMRVLVCAPNQARKVSGFNTTGNNPIITRSEKVAGSYVAQFQSDIPVGDNGMVSTILVDENFPKDKLLLLDNTLCGVVPMQNRQFSDEDATLPGGDYWRRRILGEYTFEFKNASNGHVLFENVKL